MGMYTELVMNVALKDDTPGEVLGALDWMLTSENFGERPANLPNHRLFNLDRAQVMLRMGSFYFVPDAQSALFRANHRENGAPFHLSIRCDLKNYEGEIEAFADWIAPYVECSCVNFAGYKRYEEDAAPTLLWIIDGEAEWFSIDSGSLPAEVR